MKMGLTRLPVISLSVSIDYEEKIHPRLQLDGHCALFSTPSLVLYD